MSHQFDRNNNLIDPLPNPVYEDGRTKQAFKDETDINVILKRAQKSGTISHLNRFEGRYADFSQYDFGENMQKLAEGREIFDALPPEIRSEFDQNPANFFQYVNDPANKDDLLKKLPGLAAPGRQNLDVRGNMTADEAAAAAKANMPAGPPDVPKNPNDPTQFDPDHPSPAKAVVPEPPTPPTPPTPPVPPVP